MTQTGTPTQQQKAQQGNQQQPNEGGFKVEQAAKTLRDRDEFFKETYRFFDVLAHHRKAVLVGAVALIGLALLGGLVLNRRDAHSEEAKDALFLAQKAYETEMKGLAGVKPAAEEKQPAATDTDDAKAKAAKEAADKVKRDQEAADTKKLDELAFQKLDVDAKFPETVKKYRELVVNFGGTRAAHEARLALGTLYYNHGEPAKAAPVFQQATEDAPGPFEKALALQSWGYALENAGKPAEAITAFEKALNYGKEGGIQGDSLLAIARCQTTLHDTAKARSTYDQIITQLPNSESAKSAEALKARLQ